MKIELAGDRVYGVNWRIPQNSFRLSTTRSSKLRIHYELKNKDVLAS